MRKTISCFQSTRTKDICTNAEDDIVFSMCRGHEHVIQTILGELWLSQVVEPSFFSPCVCSNDV